MDFDRSAAPEQLLTELSEKRVSDGLPVIPPTDPRVDRMLDHVNRDPGEVVLRIPVNRSEVTVEELAECATLAGCKPEYFPVVLASFEALAEWPDPEAVYGTTSGFSVATIVNGPIRNEIDLNCGTGLFGPGYRANATIGRALQLPFMLIGGVAPGTGTMATHSQQGRYLYCFGEREEESPWDPLHTELAGLDPQSNAVTVISAHVPLPLSEGTSEEAATDEDVLDALATGAIHHGAPNAGMPGEILFVLGQDHANRLGKNYSKYDIKEYIYENCKLRGTGDPLLRSPEDVLITVAGGIGNYSSAIHTMTYADVPPETKEIS